MQNSGLTKLYRNDKEFKCLVRRLTSMTFLPLSDVDEAYLCILEYAIEHRDQNFVNKFINYFYKNWLDNKSRFPCSMWNHYMNYGIRIVNHLERWHNSLNRACGSTHKVFSNILKY